MVSWPLAAATTWFSNVQVTAAHIQQYLTDPLNDLRSTAPRGQLGTADGNVTGTINLTTIGNAYASTGQSATFTLAEQRRVRIFVTALMTPASATLGRYRARAAYSSGAGIGTPVSLNPANSTPNAQATVPVTILTEANVLLTAGTYTAFATLERASGGSATDVLTNAHVDVWDMGAV